jgi:hypothetical protein
MAWRQNVRPTLEVVVTESLANLRKVRDTERGLIGPTICYTISASRQ